MKIDTINIVTGAHHVVTKLYRLLLVWILKYLMSSFIMIQLGSDNKGGGDSMTSINFTYIMIAGQMA